MGKDGSGSKKRKKEENSNAATGVSSPSSRRQKTSSSSFGQQLSTSSRLQDTTTSSKSRNSSDVVGVLYQEYCELPFTLNTLLVEECNFVTRKGFDSPHGYDCEPARRPARSVHDLPAKVTVKQVLQHYQRKRGGGGTGGDNGGSNSSVDKETDHSEGKNYEEKQKQVKKFCTGLALLFDDVLPVCLLYPEERPQYESLQLDEDLKLKRPSEIYGSTFLLRLLVRLPRLLVAEPRSEMDVMGPMVADLIVLLQKNKQACFGKDVYREPRWEELFPWEQALRQQQKKRNTTDEEDDVNNDRSMSSPCTGSSSSMAISRTP
ncbi:MRG family protein [Nitzschia inconspicua]|uniref:MRG family protein n=1 Tax=Nitzschia inconspicua TaxID=303405 RepID=A0A9K3Q024_9STRA|nr:MRG family protein [Nitzschia inconspicua]KAG7365951.1 MRG family protein [Nitzschia inconspicua]